MLKYAFFVLLWLISCLLNWKIGSETVGFDTKANKTNSTTGQAGRSYIVAASDEVGEENKEKVSQLSKSNGGVANDANKDNSGGHTGSSETSNKEMDNKETNDKQKGGSSAELQVKEDDQKGGRISSDSSKPTKVSKDKSNGAGSDVPLAKPNKEGPLAEECDASNKCTDKENKLVACLRVSGNGMHLTSLAELSLTDYVNFILMLNSCSSFLL